MSQPLPDGEIRHLSQRQDSHREAIARLIDKAEFENRGITEAEQRRIDEHMEDIRQIEDEIEDRSRSRASVDWRRQNPGKTFTVPEVPSSATYTGGGVRTSSAAYTSARGGVYNPESPSYFADLFNATRGDVRASERLDRHAREFHDATANSDLRELRAINTTVGGSFAPPLYLVDDYIAALRPGRATADALTNLPLPAGADVLNVPKIASGATTALQGAENAAISQTDITTATVSAPVYTIAGGQTLSQQLLDQSPISGSIDQVILKDLLADYAKQVGNLVLNGTGTGQPQGLITAASTVSYTDASPAFVGAAKLYSKIALAVQTVQTARYSGPTAIVMHPRRWAWISVQTDSQNRPVVVPGQNGPTNSFGIAANGNAQGHVGQMFGLPVIIDPAIPTNQGAGTNQDAILVGKLDDSWLYEGDIRAEAFPATYAPNLSVFLRLFNYVALANRTSQSLVTVTGTGLVAPTL